MACFLPARGEAAHCACEQVNAVNVEAIVPSQEQNSRPLLGRVMSAGAGFDRDSIAWLGRFHPREGVMQTAIPFLSLIRFNQPTRLMPGMLQPSVCLVVQGRKQMLLGRDVVNYGPGSYVAASVTMPAAGQVVEASKDRPYLGIKVDLDPGEIAAMVLETKLPVREERPDEKGALVAPADQALREAVMRLVRLLDSPQDLPFLAPVIKQEILYRLLTTKVGLPLWQEHAGGRENLGLAQAINWLKQNFSAPLEIETLARKSRLGISSFHRKFKAVTTLAPLQYQKRLRLLESRRLLLEGSLDAATAAFAVGYESPSQFSREYRRLFGAPPREDIDQLRQTIHWVGQD